MIPYNCEITGRIIRDLRIRQNLSQEVLSGLAGVARIHLAMIEAGTKNANVDTLWRIADALPEHALTLPEDIAARNGLAERADEEYNETKRSVSADSTEPLTDRRLVSGGIDPESVRAQEHADRFYDEIRHMSTDALHIATNTGFAEDRVVMIKRYLFTDYHDLGGERLQRFDSSFEIAQSWQRLLDGKNIQPHDITLLKHEEMEMRLVNAGLTQAQAHLAASKVYNYAKEAENYYDNTAKHKNG